MSIAFLSGLAVQEDTTWHKNLLRERYALLGCLKNKSITDLFSQKSRINIFWRFFNFFGQEP